MVTGSASGTGVYMVNALAKESGSTVVVKKMWMVPMPLLLMLRKNVVSAFV